MAEYMLLRMTVTVVGMGMFAATIMVGKLAYAARHHLHQRKEPHV